MSSTITPDGEERFVITATPYFKSGRNVTDTHQERDAKVGDVLIAKTLADDDGDVFGTIERTGRSVYVNRATIQPESQVRPPRPPMTAELPPELTVESPTLPEPILAEVLAEYGLDPIHVEGVLAITRSRAER